VEEGYFQCLQDMYETARSGKENLVLMGIEPDGPSEKYGYIKPEAGGGFAFTEKPTEEKAREYIAAGALWNGGVFAYRLKYVMEKSRELLGTSEYQELYDHYAELKKISFDYAVVEQEKSIAVLRYRGVWKDIGTWNTLAETMEEPTVGNAVIGDRCENVHIVNELDIPVLAMGMKDTVIAASPDGILVASAETADRIKPYVDTISRQIMFAEKSWGNYLVIDAEDSSLTIKANLKPMQRMNYHSHERRDEVWTIISGFGKAVIDGEETTVAPGDVIRMNAGQKHTIIAGEQGLQLIEVQLGKDISVSDKKKY
jgi:mannose-1-phosphate guanylyltransferase